MANPFAHATAIARTVVERAAHMRARELADALDLTDREAVEVHTALAYDDPVARANELARAAERESARFAPLSVLAALARLATGVDDPEPAAHVAAALEACPTPAVVAHLVGDDADALRAALRAELAPVICAIAEELVDAHDDDAEPVDLDAARVTAGAAGDFVTADVLAAFPTEVAREVDTLRDGMAPSESDVEEAVEYGADVVRGLAGAIDPQDVVAVAHRFERDDVLAVVDHLGVERYAERVDEALFRETPPDSVAFAGHGVEWSVDGLPCPEAIGAREVFESLGQLERRLLDRLAEEEASTSWTVAVTSLSKHDGYMPDELDEIGATEHMVVDVEPPCVDGTHAHAWVELDDGAVEEKVCVHCGLEVEARRDPRCEVCGTVVHGTARRYHPTPLDVAVRDALHFGARHVLVSVADDTGVEENDLADAVDVEDAAVALAEENDDRLAEVLREAASELAG